jgi:hypothetical protein
MLAPLGERPRPSSIERKTPKAGTRFRVRLPTCCIDRLNPPPTAGITICELIAPDRSFECEQRSLKYLDHFVKAYFGISLSGDIGDKRSEATVRCECHVPLARVTAMILSLPRIFDTWGLVSAIVDLLNDEAGQEG